MSLKLFAKNLRYLRLKRGFKTQEDLGKKLGVSRATVSWWENGYAYPGLYETLFRLCDVLKVKSIDQFIRTDMTKARSGRIGVKVMPAKNHLNR